MGFLDARFLLIYVFACEMFCFYHVDFNLFVCPVFDVNCVRLSACLKFDNLYGYLFSTHFLYAFSGFMLPVGYYLQYSYFMRLFRYFRVF